MKRALQVAFCLSAAVFVLLRFPPERYLFYPACPFHALTGWDCPGCGSTRAFAALLHGQFLRSLSLNPLLPLLALATCLVRRFREHFERHETTTALALGSSMVILTVVRNVLHF